MKVEATNRANLLMGAMQESLAQASISSISACVEMLSKRFVGWLGSRSVSHTFDFQRLPASNDHHVRVGT